MPSFFFNDTATTEIYTLSLHDALPIFRARRLPEQRRMVCAEHVPFRPRHFPAGGSHRAVSDAWRHVLRSAFLHAAGAHRTEVRHHRRAATGDVSRLLATTGQGLGSLLHLAAV